MDNLGLIKVEKKLNIKHVAIVIIGLIFLILFLIIICKRINVAFLNYGDNYSANKFLKLQENKILEEQTKEAEAKQKEIDKFKPLNSEELENVSKIYSHSEPKRVFLTFDDGPTKQVTPYILDELKNQNVKASFFVLGSKVEQNPSLVKQAYMEGNFIGNHGYSHTYSTIYESFDSLIGEYNKTQQAIRDAIGNQNYNSLVFRFPGGSVGGYYNDFKLEAKQTLNSQGIGNVDWNALTKDADGAKSKEAILNNFYDTIQGKTSIVLLMHDAGDKILTYETLPDIISYLKSDGYEFKTLYDVIGRK